MREEITNGDPPASERRLSEKTSLKNKGAKRDILLYDKCVSNRYERVLSDNFIEDDEGVPDLDVVLALQTHHQRLCNLNRT